MSFIVRIVLLSGLMIGLGLSSQAMAQPQPTAKPEFKDGQAQVVEAFNNAADWIRQDLWVETEFDSDGDGKLDRMHVDVTRQKQTETEGLKVAVIYGTSPYFSGVAQGGSQFFWDPKHELGATPPEHEHPPEIPHQSRRPTISNSMVDVWLPRGFAVVHSCSPGTGLSQGCPTVGGDNESLAPKAVIDWLCGRAKGFTTPDGDEEVKCDWCTGKVGMTGTSYNGTLPLACATTGVEGLECIIPVAPNTSYYHYYRSNGLIRHPGGYMGEDIDVLYDFINSGDPEKREGCNCEVRDKLMADNQDRITGDYNDFWAGRDYLNKLDNVKAACLMAHGFNDWNVMPEHSVRIYEALKAKGLPVQCYYHQGGHGGDPPLEQMNKWFSRYLYNIENNVEEDPKAWIVREDARRNKPTSYADYPNPEAKPIVLKLSGDGNKVGQLSIDASTETAAQSLTDDVNLTGNDLASASESKNRLLFATAELKEPVHISGHVKFKVRVASSKPAANLSVWLVSLPWTDSRRITDNVITRGWADPQNHKSLRESEPLVPGEFYDLEFELQPDDQLIAAGQKIGLMIFSSDRDFTLWPEPGTELTIDLENTSIELPVVGGAEAMTKALNQ
ncbi:MAG: Xaa-Pro dipeptidyl-peptidase [Pirellulaceae bacterium]